MVVLEDVTLSDHGLYVCNISNPIGFITTETQLFVYGPTSSPVWDYDGVVVEATSILFVWERPVITYGLEVDFYVLLVSSELPSYELGIQVFMFVFLQHKTLPPDSIFPV